MELFKKNIFYAKLKFFRNFSFQFYNQLLKNQTLSNDELFDLNWKKRKRLLFFAYEHVPFYSKKYKNAGMLPEDIDTPDEYKKVPLLTKDDLRDCFSELISKNINPRAHREVTTGGSTGVPVKVLHDKRVPLEAAGWRTMQWWGVEPFDNIAFIYRLNRRNIKKILNDVLWWPTRRLFLDAASMTDEKIFTFIKSYNKIQPLVLQGYGGAVYDVALFLEKNKISFNSTTKAVWVTSSPLFRPQRKKMETIFCCPVYDQYGCSEINWIASECKEQNHLHILSDIRHVEFLDNSNKESATGEYGDLVITDLENYVFPLIRYKVGDRGRKLSKICPCGNSLPLMDSVKGRISDSFILPSGRIISGDYLTTIFDDYTEVINEFQVRQHEDYSIKILCIPNPGNSFNDVIEKVINELIKKTKSEVPINVETTRNIPHDKGKTRFIISDLKFDNINE